MTSRTRKLAAKIKRALGGHRASTGEAAGFAYATELWLFVIVCVAGLLYELWFS